MSAFEDVVEAWGFKIAGDKPAVLSPAGIAPDGSIVYSDAESFRDLIGAEPELGNPSVNGWVLSSSSAGVRSWVAPNAHSHAIADVVGLQAALDARSLTSHNHNALYLGISATAAAATKLATGRTIGITGDATWTSPTFDGTANVTAALTLASVITAGGPVGGAATVPVITYDAKGRLTAVTTATITPAAIGAQPAGSYASSSHNHTLDSLSNTTITSIATGELLRWNGTAWVNATLSEAGIQPAGSYLTGNQTITLSGIVTGSGATAITTSIADAALSIAKTSGLQAALDDKVSISASRVTHGTYVNSATSAMSLAARHAAGYGMHFGHWYNIAEAPRTGYFNFMMLPETKTGDIHNTLAFSNSGAIEAYIGRGNNSSAEMWRRIWTDGDFSATNIAAWNAKQDALGYVPVNKAGDTMTGGLTLTTLNTTGLATLQSLKVTAEAGSGNRLVQAGADGTQSASIPVPTAYIQTLMDDANAATARTTLGAAHDVQTNMGYSLEGTDPFANRNAHGTQGGVRTWLGVGPFASSNQWHNVVDVRHRNGTGDGATAYGGQLVWGFPSTPRLAFRATGDAWTEVWTKANLINPTTGTGETSRMAYWSTTNTLSSSAKLQFDGSNLLLGNTAGGLLTSLSSRVMTSMEFICNEKQVLSTTGTATLFDATSSIILAINGASKLSLSYGAISASNSVLPTLNDSYDLGSSTHRFANVHARNVYVGGNAVLTTATSSFSGNISFSSISADVRRLKYLSDDGTDGVVFDVSGTFGANLPSGAATGTVRVYAGQLNLQSDYLWIPAGEFLWYRDQAGNSARVAGSASININRQCVTVIKFPNEWRVSGLLYV